MSTASRHILFTAVILFMTLNMHAQNGPDPERALMFKKYARIAVKNLTSEDKNLGENLTLHKFTKDEVGKTADLQREFNDYLTKFSHTLTYAAEIYAIYYEVDQAVKNIKDLKSISVSCPANILAVAFSKSRSHIYQDVIDNGLQIAKDVKHFLSISKDPDKDAKMTEAERIECIGNIRSTLRSMNYKLRKMSRLMRYTTIMDSWYELKGTYRKPKSMIEICNESKRRWAEKAQAATKLNTK